MTYLSIEKLTRLERCLALVQTKKVAGDYLEFGVALGGSAIIIASAMPPATRFHGFDVFAMIPPPTSVHDDEKSRARYEVIREGKSVGIDGDDYYGYTDNLLDKVKNSFSLYGVPVIGSMIQLHQGLFEDTWPDVSIERVAFAHVDCDWYDPVMYCLNSVRDKMSKNGIILIDDYHDYGGARVAVDEFVGKNSDFVFEDGANPMLVKIR